MIWDRNDYLKEVQKQLSGRSTYLETKVIEKDLVDLVQQSNKMFGNLQRRRVIQEREENYFKFNFKKGASLGKLLLLPKIHMGLNKIPVRLVVANCETPTEKVSEFLDHQIQPIMKLGNSDIRDTGDFLEKLRATREIPKESILVTAHVVGIYPSIPHNEGLKALQNQYDKFIYKIVFTEYLIKMADFVLKDDWFEINSKFYKHIRGSNRYKVCSTVCLHCYGLHRNRALKIS